MIAWIKKLFKENKTSDVEEEQRVDMLYGISEPVISFVNTFKRRPQTFKFDFISLKHKMFLWLNTSKPSQSWSTKPQFNLVMRDKVTGESWGVWISLYPSYNLNENTPEFLARIDGVEGLPDWLSKAEENYILREIFKTMNKRLSKTGDRKHRTQLRLEARRAEQKRLNDINERKRLMELYK